MKYIYAIAFYSLISLQSARAGDITLYLGTQSIHATIAYTPVSREQGLMKQTRLCENCGMLFVFPKAANYKFWMKDTPLPLSIAFVAADGRIIDLTEMQPNTRTLHGTKGDVLYALEMNKGWFTEHAIRTDAYIQGLKGAPSGE